MQNYDIGSTPENKKEFFTNEIAELCGISFGAVGNLAYRLRIVPRSVKVGSAWRKVYTYEEMRAMVDAVTHREKRAPVVTKDDEAAEHPLVTDLRCLKINYWPDTEPACFEGLDDDD